MSSDTMRLASNRLPATHLGAALAASLLAAAIIAPASLVLRYSVLETEPPASQSWAEKNPGCLEWSDACFVCKRGDDGKAKCSTVGIACTSGDIVCKAEKGK